MDKSPNSARGVSYGGGKSSLGYLFGGDDKKQQKTDNPPPPIVFSPPYGIDDENENPSENSNTSITYQKSQGQNSGIFITGRPSTKVKSVPGGDSSLGYLFGDKS
ncbi:hypothetical protein K7X08_029433 [Anisodus acutangulus]|uniref:Protein SPIRAL1-like 5 n=2 Tax=Anisodus TaxID=243963 RepID=A0A9Q1QUR4_9SOLA|nr:hypothetical protein K7X08_029433 [Anisodus acutangulus]KAK4338456.1 hypothetical protein RND71_042943 [Anisodus tanguticus]